MTLTSVMLRRCLGLSLATAALTALASFGGVAQAAPAQGEILHAGGATAIAESYIVVFKDSAVSGAGVDQAAADMAGRFGGSITHIYRHALRGFAVSMPETAARRLAAQPSVAFVEQNHTVTISGTQSPTSSWGLDRIDQRDLPLDSSYTFPNNGSGVHAYIVDTGIRITHNDSAAGRATGSISSIMTPTRATATATARMWPVRWAARPLA